MNATPFRRMIVRFQHRTPSHQPLRIVAELANALRLELLGLYVRDPNLAQLLQHPEVREYRIRERRWSSVERVEIAEHLDRAIRTAERDFSEVLQAIELSGDFEVAPEHPAGAAAETVRAEDIIVVCEPENPIEQLGLPFLNAIGAALASARAAMIVPRRVARTHGAVVALAEAPGDPVIPVAKQIASSVNERLVTVDLRGARHLHDLASRLLQVAPRLVLVSRGTLDGHEAKALWQVANACQVPVLVIEAGRSTPPPPPANTQQARAGN